MLRFRARLRFTSTILFAFYFNHPRGFFTCGCVCLYFFFLQSLLQLTTMGPAKSYVVSSRHLTASSREECNLPPSLLHTYLISRRPTNRPSRTIQGVFCTCLRVRLVSSFFFTDLLRPTVCPATSQPLLATR